MGELIRVTALDPRDLEALRDQARQEGYRFLDRLHEEYLTGINRFEAPGEALFGVIQGAEWVAIGGLNRDPYRKEREEEVQVGRVRRLYVAPCARRQGVGRLLVKAVVAEARCHYRLLTLRTTNPSAAAFYESLGFHQDVHHEDITHSLVLL